MTKHGFLEKLKSTAAKTGNQRNSEPNSKHGANQMNVPSRKWDALKDDLMLKATKVIAAKRRSQLSDRLLDICTYTYSFLYKNWDEESSDGERSIGNAGSSAEEAESSRSKRRKLNARE